jgi:hypothetical protein
MQNRAFAPVDVSSLAFFRIAFGLPMLWRVGRYWFYDQIYLVWISLCFLFGRLPNELD